jgi:sigma-B regulation protein RsbU (phosphoserine phosphatase)
MANLQASIRSQAAIAHDSPERLLESVNRHLHSNTAPAAYATLFFGEYDEKSGVLRYVNCGHPPALIARADGRAEYLSATATVLGLFPRWDCELVVTRLDPGDTLVLYTDGVSECSNVNGEEFGIERLTSTIRRGGMLNDVFDELRRFGGEEPQDDVTMIVARRL